MTDIAAAMTLRVAEALREISPHYSDWLRECAEAKIKHARLRAKYEEAIADIVDWGSYAGEYFQKKHDLKGCIEDHRKALEESK